MSECLSDSAVERLLAGELDDLEEDQVEAHLGECPTCRDTLRERSAPPDAMREALVSDSVSGHDPTLEAILKDSVSSLNRLRPDTGAAEDETPALPDLPGYEVLEEIGRGGLGVVFKARQTALDRIVAVKMIRSGTFAGPQERARFRREAEAVARLEHPNIVRVQDIVEIEGNPCLFMEYVPGADLAKRLGGTPQPADSAARLVEILARAMHRVHEAGFLHRDLKPANILLAESSDAESGVWLALPDDSSTSVLPKISDFGLAKPVGEEQGLTETRAALGTPSYMSPEQAKAAADVTPSADVYSLGAILYEALVGRPPFRSTTVVETMAQVIHEDPVPPRRLVARIPVDLEAVCLRCLRKDPARRYPTAEALADDLRRFQEGVPTRARPTAVFERVWRWCGRHRAVATLLALFLLTLVAATTVTSILLVRAKGAEADRAIEAERARAAAKEAESALEEARQVSGLLNIDLLAAIVPDRKGRDVKVRDLLDAASERIDREASPGGRFANLPKVHAEIRSTIGWAYYWLGEYEAALPHMEKSLRVLREVLGDDHVDTIATATNTALVYRNLGRNDDATALFERTLKSAAGVLPADNLLTLQIRNNLALQYKDRGRLEEAESMFRRIIEASEGEGSQDLVEQRVLAQGNLAIVLSERGRVPEAELMLRELLETIRLTMGPDHPRALQAKVNLAEIIGRQGKADEAVGILEPLLEKVIRVYGSEHNGTLFATMTLGANYLELGRYADAARLLERAGEVYAKRRGPKHSETLSATLELGRAYLGQKRFAEAEEELKRVHQIAQAGGMDALDRKAIETLVKLYEAWGKPDEAAAWRAKLPE